MGAGPRLMNAISNALIGIVLVATLLTAGWWVTRRPMFALHAVVVDAVPGQTLRRVDRETLAAADVRGLDGNFFTVDLDAVRARFEQLAWVRRAQVRRVWPDRIVVALEEHRVFAAWGDGRLVNEQGELFRGRLADLDDEDEGELAQRLPELTGPEGTETQVTQRYRELAAQLGTVGLKPVALTLSPRYAWSAELESGMTLVLGRDQGVPVPERVERFVSAWPRLLERIGDYRGPVDLRYSNGFAIRTAAVDEMIRVAAPAPADRNRKRQ